MNKYLIKFTYTYLHLDDELHYVAQSPDAARRMFKDEYGRECRLNDIICLGPAKRKSRINSRV